MRYKARETMKNQITKALNEARIEFNYVKSKDLSTWADRAEIIGTNFYVEVGRGYVGLVEGAWYHLDLNTIKKCVAHLKTHLMNIDKTNVGQ